MRPILASLGLALLGFSSSAAPSGAQHPSFSGVWTRVADSAAERSSVARTGDAPFQRGDAGSGWGSPLTITQDAARITVQYEVFGAYDLQPPLRLTFALDGSPSVNPMMLSHTTSTLRSTAAWKDGALVITTRYPGPSDSSGAPIDAQVTQVLRLESPTRLVIETTRSASRGLTTTSRTVYTK
jgi:hypothetical protein